MLNMRCSQGTDCTGKHTINAAPSPSSPSTVIAVPLRDDVVAQRQAQPRPLARRLRREKRLENLLPDRLSNARSVIGHADLHLSLPLPRRDCHRRRKLPVVRQRPLVHRVEGVVQQVDEDPPDLLRCHLHLSYRFVIVSL